MKRVALMKVTKKDEISFIFLILKQKFRLSYSGVQQQTEIIFTEDDSSCDSQKWGN